MTKQIGLFGFGTVAQGFYNILSESDLDVNIKRIAVKRQDMLREVDASLITTDANDILLDPEIDIIIELVDDADFAYQIVKSSLEKGIPVISANKKMIAEHIEEVITWHEIFDAPFLYEGAVGGSIPILQNLETFFKHQKINRVRGILNGSSNYILTKMRESKLSFSEALKATQAAGFAESDPSLDISGKDAAYKLIILAYHAFGQTISELDQIRMESITNMEDHFFQLAAEQNMKIKQVATAYFKNGILQLKVQPELVQETDELFGVELENNAIVIDGEYAGRQVLSGKGAGGLATGASVFNDLTLVLQGFRYKRRLPRGLQKSA